MRNYPTRYLANQSTQEIHDLAHELDTCAIDLIVATSDDRPIHFLETADIQGYRYCDGCFNQSKEKSESC